MPSSVQVPLAQPLLQVVPMTKPPVPCHALDLSLDPNPAFWLPQSLATRASPTRGPSGSLPQSPKAGVGPKQMSLDSAASRSSKAEAACAANTAPVSGANVVFPGVGDVHLMVAQTLEPLVDATKPCVAGAGTLQTRSQPTAQKGWSAPVHNRNSRFQSGLALPRLQVRHVRHPSQQHQGLLRTQPHLPKVVCQAAACMRSFGSICVALCGPQIPTHAML